MTAGLIISLAIPQVCFSEQKSTTINTIIVDNYYPYTFVNSEGQPDGFSVELIKAVSEVMGLEIEISVGPWDDAMDSLKKGEIDLLPMMAYSELRDKTYDFSPPHTIAYDAFFIRNDSEDIRSIDDLKNKTIIVMNKDAAHDFITQQDWYNKDNLILIDTIPDALRRLSSGEGDTALMPKIVGIVVAKNLKLTNIAPSPMVFDNYTRPFSFAVKEGSQELLERLTQGLNILKETGVYGKIYYKWFSAYEASKGISRNILLTRQANRAEIVYNIGWKNEMHASSAEMHSRTFAIKQCV